MPRSDVDTSKPSYVGHPTVDPATWAAPLDWFMNTAIIVVFIEWATALAAVGRRRRAPDSRWFRRGRLGLCSVLAGALQLALTSPCRADVPYPDPDWTAVPAARPNMASPDCRRFQANFFGSKPNESPHTDGLVVIKDGRLVYERYDPAYGPRTPHILWSASKSVIATLLGIAVAQGKLHLDDRLATFFPGPATESGPQRDHYALITIRDLLQMAANFDWQEDYGTAPDPTKSNALEMLYGSGHADMAAYTMDRPQAPDGPGKHWVYNSGVSNVLAAVLAKVWPDHSSDYPWTMLFDRLGMRNVSFERDGSGTFIGSSYVFMTPRDMARLGYLYLTGGMWKGDRVLPADWPQFVSTIGDAVLSSKTELSDITSDGLYGGGFWLNGRIRQMRSLLYPHAPPNIYFASGHFGQLIFILPSQNMVVARTGWDGQYDSLIDGMAASAASCFGGWPWPQSVSASLPVASAGNGRWFARIFTGVERAHIALDAGILQANVARELCSCHFVSGLGPALCMARSNSDPSALKLITWSLRDVDRTVTVKPDLAGRMIAPQARSASASLDRGLTRAGCALSPLH